MLEGYELQWGRGVGGASDADPWREFSPPAMQVPYLHAELAIQDRTELNGRFRVQGLLVHCVLAMIRGLSGRLNQ